MSHWYRNIRNLLEEIQNSPVEESSPMLTPEMIEKIMSSHYVKGGIKIPHTAKLYRGTNEESGSGMATFGSGLYFTTNLKVAKQYAGETGKVHTLDRDVLPRNALRFDTMQNFELWLQDAIFKVMGFDDKRDFYKVYPDFRDFIKALDPHLDGLQIFTGKEAYIVNYDARRIA